MPSTLVGAIEFVGGGDRVRQSRPLNREIVRALAEFAGQSECQGAERLNRIDRLIERMPSTSRRESTFAAMRNENVVTEFGRWLLTEFVNFA